MKYISWIISLLLAIVVVTFAINNLGNITVDLWPLGMVAKWPAYLVVLLSVLFGFLYGAAVTWLSGHATRQEARRQRAEARRLARELESFRKSSETRSTGPAVPQLPAAAGD